MLSANSILRFEFLTCSDQRTDLDLPDEDQNLYGALPQPFAPLGTPSYTLKDKALLDDRAPYLYKYVNSTLKVPRKELFKTTFHYSPYQGIDIKFEGIRNCK
jgi:hypothetical protein